MKAVKELSRSKGQKVENGAKDLEVSTGSAMDIPKFKIEWNDHHPFLIQLLHGLLERESLVDVTLAAEGQFIRVHRLILGACSHYFEELLNRDAEKQTIIFLKDVKFEDVKAVVDFMYRGEVNIPQDQLETFLCTAKSLKIKGLDFTKPHDLSNMSPGVLNNNNNTTTKKESPAAPLSAPRGYQPVKSRNSTGQRVKDKKTTSLAVKTHRSSLPSSSTRSGSPVSGPPAKQSKGSPEEHQEEIDVNMEDDPLEKNPNNEPDKDSREDVSADFRSPPALVAQETLNGKETPPVIDAVMVEFPKDGESSKLLAEAPANGLRRTSNPTVIFSCKLCPFNSVTNFQYKMHMKRKHPVVA